VRTVLSTCLFALACGPGGESPGQGAQEEPDSDRSDLGSAQVELHSDVETFLNAYLNAIASRDTEALRSQLVDSPRYVWAEDGAVRYRSVDEMLVGLASFPPNTPIETELSDMYVPRVGRDGAHAAASFQTRVGEGDGSFAFGGLITFVLERQGDGWRIVGGHVSSSAPAERPSEAGGSGRG
jgi:SnoaL-like domain